MFGFGKKKKEAPKEEAPKLNDPAAPPALPELTPPAATPSNAPASGSAALPELPDLDHSSAPPPLPEMPAPSAPADDFGLPSFDDGSSAAPEAPAVPEPSVPDVPEEINTDPLNAPAMDFPDEPTLDAPADSAEQSADAPAMATLEELEAQTGQEISEAQQEEPLSFSSDLPSSESLPSYHTDTVVNHGEMLVRFNHKENCAYVDVDGFKQLAQDFVDAQEQFAEVSRLIRVEDGLIKKEESHIKTLRSDLRDVHNKLKKIDKIIFEG